MYMNNEMDFFVIFLIFAANYSQPRCHYKAGSTHRFLRLWEGVCYV